MSVSVTASQRRVTRPQLLDATPLGHLLITGSVAGDGSGGSSTISVTLDRDFAYQILYACSAKNAATAVAHEIVIDTGHVLDNVSEQIVTSIDSVAGVGGQSAVLFDLPNHLWHSAAAPGGVGVAQIVVMSTNVNGATHFFSCRLNVWSMDQYRRYSDIVLLGSLQ